MIKESTKQALIFVCVGMLVISGIMIYVSLTSPRVYDEDTLNETTQAVQNVNNENLVYSSSNELTFPVNLNTATVDELSAINGVGEKRASDIIAYREQIGKYKSVDEIKNIKGIGDGLYEQIAPYLTV